MAEGGEYALRQNTLNYSDESERTETERLRKRLQVLEERKKKKEDLESLREQRDRLINERRSRQQHSTPYSNARENEERDLSRRSYVDLSTETHKLDERLQELEREELQTSQNRESKQETLNLPTDLGRTDDRIKDIDLQFRELEESFKRIRDLSPEGSKPERIPHMQATGFSKDLKMMTDKIEILSTSVPKLTNTTVEEDRESSQYDRKLRVMKEDIKERREAQHSSFNSMDALVDDKLLRLQKDREDMDRREHQLRLKEKILEDKEHEINEHLKERERDFTRCELRLEQLQQKMIERFEEMERNLKEKEYNLLERKRQIEEEHACRRIELDEMEKRCIERELGLRDQPKYSQKSFNHGLSDNRRVLTESIMTSHNPLENLERRIRELERKGEPIVESSRIGEGIEFREESKDTLGIKLNLTTFSGREPVPKNEASFDDFKMEFESVQQIYSEQVLKQALRKCLKDQARKVMMHMGAQTTVSQIMENLEKTFGNVASEDSLLAKFLSAEQKSDESIVEWSLRLESLLLQIERKSRISRDEKRTYLKNRFWRGLRNEELKQATRLYFESEITYEELRNRVRAEEYEQQLQKDRSNTKGKGGKIQLQTVVEHTDPNKETLEAIVKKIENLDSKIEEMRSSTRGRGFRRGNDRGRGYNRGSPSVGRGANQQRTPLPTEEPLNE